MASNVTGRISNFKESEWVIENFENFDLDNINKSIRSPDFSYENHAFYLKVLGLNLRNAHSVLLKVKSQGIFDMHCCLSIKLSDETLYGTEDASNVRSSYTFSDFILKSVLNERPDDFLKEKALTFVVGIQDREAGIKPRRRKLRKEEDIIYKNTDLLANDLAKLYKEQINSDVTIKVASKEIKTHESILCSRSPVLGLNFKHSTMENSSKVIEIKDPDIKDGDCFEKYIKYLYTGSVKVDTPSRATELYVIAHKYQCDEIQTFCVKFLVENICTENVCNIIEFALKYDETYLNKRAEDFFKQNVTAILETDDWLQFISRNHILATTLLKNMAKFRLLD